MNFNLLGLLSKPLTLAILFFAIPPALAILFPFSPWSGSDYELLSLANECMAVFLVLEIGPMKHLPRLFEVVTILLKLLQHFFIFDIDHGFSVKDLRVAHWPRGCIHAQ